MPFGLTNALATFQAYINYTLQGLVDVFCIVYLDNIFIFSKLKEEYYKHIELVIECLQQVELYANPKKYNFLKSKMEFLGFIINKDRLHIDPTYIQTIVEQYYYLPKTYQDIQVFLGFYNFYQQFIYSFASIAQPLHQLLYSIKNSKKPSLIANNQQKLQQEVFEQLINIFITTLVLHYYNLDCNLCIETNILGTTCTSILSQKQKNKQYPIVYFLRKFSRPKLNYPIYNKELLAIVLSFH